MAVALGNWGSAEAVPALVAALDDEEPLVRGHAAWALERIGGDAARAALEGRGEVEEDGWVREEISAALASATRPRAPSIPPAPSPSGSDTCAS